MYEKALRLIEYSFQTEYMLRTKLEKKKFDSKYIYLVLEKLKDLNLLNDKLYAKDYCKYLVETKYYGRIKILSNFKKKGLQTSLYTNIIDDTIEKNGGEEEIILKNIKKNISSYLRLFKKNNEINRKNKIKQKLYNQGFSLSVIFNIIDDINLILQEKLN